MLANRASRPGIFGFFWGGETLSKPSETGSLTGDLESAGWGGKRARAGRPVGIQETQPRRMGKARKLCRLRVPADATPYERDLAQQALDAIVSVMNGEVSAEQQSGVLRAAIHLREELLGKPSQRHVLEGPDGGGVKFEFVLNHEEAPRRLHESHVLERVTQTPAREASSHGRRIIPTRSTGTA